MAAPISQMSSQLSPLETLAQKKKTYWVIFAVLGALTVFELAIVFAPIPQLAVTLLVVTASLAKACAVGWWYMHLNHETKGLKLMLMAPLFVAFFYAVFLIADSKLTQKRHANPYVGEPVRFFGPRNIVDRQVDEFGNSIEVAPPAAPHAAAHGTGSAEASASASSSSSSESSVSQ